MPGGRVPHASRSVEAVTRAQTFRIYPTVEQAGELDRFIAAARRFYNEAVAHQRARRRAGGSHESLMSLAYAVKPARELPEYQGIPAKVLHGALKELDMAYRLFFEQRKRGAPASPPRFRSAERRRWSIRYQEQHDSGPNPWSKMIRAARTGSVRWSEIRLINVGWVRVRLHRPLPDDALVGFAIVQRDAVGDWWLTVQYQSVLPKRRPTGQVAGVDRGATVTLVTDQGEMFNMPGPTLGRQRRRLRLEQRLARARRNQPCRTEVWAPRPLRKGGISMRLVRGCTCPTPGPGEAPPCWHHSRSYKRTARDLSRLRRHERCVTDDGAHKASRALANRYDKVIFEDLHTPNMTASAAGTEDEPGRNARAKAELGRSIARSGWHKVETRTAYKTEVDKVPAAHTSQTCPQCGHIDARNRPSRDRFFCVRCGHSGHADQIAARNIRARGLAALTGDSESSVTPPRPADAQPVAAARDLSAPPGQEVDESRTIITLSTAWESPGGGSDPQGRSQLPRPGLTSPRENEPLVPPHWGIGVARKPLQHARSRRGKPGSGRNGSGNR